MTGSQQGVSTMDRFNPAGCQGGNSSRGILSSHSHMSPESVRLMHRHRSVHAAATHTQRNKSMENTLCGLTSSLPPPPPQPSEPAGLHPPLVVLPLLAHVQRGGEPSHHDRRPDGRAPRGPASHAGQGLHTPLIQSKKCLLSVGTPQVNALKYDLFCSRAPPPPA